MEKTIKRALSLLLLVVCIVSSGIIMTGCGDDDSASKKPTQTSATRSFTAKEVLELLDEEYHIIGGKILSDIRSSYSSVDSIGNYTISKWEKAKSSKNNEIKYTVYGTCTAYNKFGEYYDGFRFTADVTIENKDEFTYTYYGTYSDSSAALYFYVAVNYEVSSIYTAKR